MKFLFALLVVGVGAKTLWHQLDDYTFEGYLKEYNKFYPEGDVYEYRKGLFLKKLAGVRKHNADPTKSWKNGINKFSDRTHEEFKAMATGRTHTPLPSVTLEDLNRKYGADPPATIDWRTKNAVTKVKNQGGCGSCWAFAGTETIESHVAISTGKLLLLSEQNVVDCTQNPRHCGGTGGCEGATAELAIDYVHQKGISLESAYPYKARDGKCQEIAKAAHTGAFVKLKENDHDDLYNAIGTVGPMAISVCADFADYELGLFRGCQKSCTIDHGVQAVGYGSSGGKDYWIVRNSWGANWGDHGYINLQRFGTSDAYCGMDNNAHDGTACDGDPDKVKICGMCGILYDSCYPANATLA